MDMHYNNDNKVSFEILSPLDGEETPVSIASATLERTPGEPSKVKFVIHRDLNVPISSFSLAYRFASLTFPISDHTFTERTYSDGVLNRKEDVLITLLVLEKTSISGGFVFVSSVTYESGKVVTYTPRVYLEGNVENSGTVSGKSGDAGESSDDDSEGDLWETESSEEGSIKSSRVRKIIVGVSSAAAIAISVGVGAHLITYGNAVEKAADKLMAERRYNEAYKIVSDTIFDSTLQNVCESAAKYYLSQEDYFNAFVYAKGAADPFEEDVIKLAQSELLSEDGLSINENALSVIRQVGDPADFDSAMISLADECMEAGEYVLAMNVSQEIGSDTDRESKCSVIFTEGIKHYMNEGMFDKAAALIDVYDSSDAAAGELSEYLESVGIDVSALIEECQNSGGSASAVILTNYLGGDSSSIAVDAEDLSIRKNLKTAYPMLSLKQKRDYHAQRFALYKGAFFIKDGAIEGTDITDAISVDTNEYQTVVLHADGRVTSLENGGHNLVIDIPEGGNTVQISAGQYHVALLDDDGTVSAYGDNTYGQCDTGSWTDIVAVATGANFTLGLRSNGEVVACGSNMSGQCDVSSYSNVVDIDACDQTAVLLFNDGKMAVCGDVSMGLREVSDFENITRISAGDACIVAERADGRYLSASGTVSGNCGSTGDWHNAEWFAAGSVCAGYIDTAGNMIITGDGAPAV